MKHTVSELEGMLLDIAVARTSGLSPVISDDGRFCMLDDAKSGRFYPASTDWGIGGPIIEREQIELACRKSSPPRMLPALWRAEAGEGLSTWTMNGSTPLVAAMRAYVASKFGDEVELP